MIWLKEKRERRALINSIVSARRTGFSTSHVSSMRNNFSALTTDDLRRLERLHSDGTPEYYPELLTDIFITAPPERAKRIRRIANVVSVARKIMPKETQSDDDSDIQFLETQALIKGLLTLLPVPDGTVITREQDEALLRTTVLLDKHDDMDIRDAAIIGDVDCYTIASEVVTQVLKSDLLPAATATRVTRRFTRRVELEGIFNEPLAHENLLEYHHELIDELYELKKSSPRTYKMVRDRMVRGVSESEVDEAIALFPLLQDVGELVADEIIKTAKTYQGVTSEQYVALLWVTGALMGITRRDDISISTVIHAEHGKLRFIRDDRIVQLVMAKPHLVMELVAAIKERDTGDFEVLSNVVLAPALGEGYL